MGLVVFGEKKKKLPKCLCQERVPLIRVQELAELNCDFQIWLITALEKRMEVSTGYEEYFLSGNIFFLHLGMCSWVCDFAIIH